MAESNDGLGVLVGGQLVGVFAFRLGYQTPGASPDTMYMLTDFAVAPSDYTRLSKLVLYAARSREAQLIAERMARRRMRFVFTTAFSHNPISMKYRGLFDLHSRKETPEGDHPYMLNYVAPIGSWTLAEGYAQWCKKHGQISSRGEISSREVVTIESREEISSREIVKDEFRGEISSREIVKDEFHGEISPRNEIVKDEFHGEISPPTERSPHA